MDSIVDPIVLPDREIPGFVSSRCMAAWTLDDGFVIQIALHEVVKGRLHWHFLLEQRGSVVAEGFALKSSISASYGEVALDALQGLAIPGVARYAKES
jgi:hypothetical protein